MIPALVSPLVPVIAAGMIFLSSMTATLITDLGLNWHKGEINGYVWEGKIYQEPSRFGIDGGRVSKLRVVKDGKVVAQYDRGWDIPPGDEETSRVVNEVLHEAGDK
jgi:hypothetical protein